MLNRTLNRTRTLSLRTELRRQIARRRTHIGLALMVIVPLIVLAAFQFGGGDGDSEGTDGFTALVDLATNGAWNFTVFTLFVCSFLALIVVALFFGDTVASEASWGSLRYLLAIPIPRARLLIVKAIAATCYSVLALVLLASTAWVAGALTYGTGALQLPAGGTVEGMAALGRVVGVVGYIAVGFAFIAGLAFLLSVSTDAPLGAVGGAVLIQIISSILEAITALGDFRQLLPTWFNTAWLGLLTQPIDTDDMIKGGISALIYATVFFVLAWWRFVRKDITS